MAGSGSSQGRIPSAPGSRWMISMPMQVKPVCQQRTSAMSRVAASAKPSPCYSSEYSSEKQPDSLCEATVSLAWLPGEEQMEPFRVSCCSISTCCHDIACPPVFEDLLKSNMWKFSVFHDVMNE
jgi:hypothetical protein